MSQGYDIDYVIHQLYKTGNVFKQIVSFILLHVETDYMITFPGTKFPCVLLNSLIYILFQYSYFYTFLYLLF